MINKSAKKSMWFTFFPLACCASLFVIFANFTILDLFVTMFSLFFILSSHLIKFVPRNEVIKFLFVVSSILLTTINNAVDISIHSILVYTELLFLLFVVPYFIRRFFILCPIDLVLNCILCASIIYALIIGLNYFYPVGIVEVSGIGRYFITLAGQKSVFIIGFSYMTYLFSDKKISPTLYIAFSLLLFCATFLSGERSMFLGLFLVTSTLIFKRYYFIILLTLTLTLILILISSNSSEWCDVVDFLPNNRINNELLTDNDRSQILSEFFLAILENPLVLIRGFGVDSWLSSEGNVPHACILSLISSFGLIVGLIYISTVYLFIFFYRLPSSFSRKKFYMLVFLGVLPDLLTHPHSLQRENIVFFMILSFYFYQDLLVTRASSIQVRN